MYSNNNNQPTRQPSQPRFAGDKFFLFSGHTFELPYLPPASTVTVKENEISITYPNEEATSEKLTSLVAAITFNLTQANSKNIVRVASANNEITITYSGKDNDRVDTACWKSLSNDIKRCWKYQELSFKLPKLPDGSTVTVGDETITIHLGTNEDSKLAAILQEIKDALSKSQFGDITTTVCQRGNNNECSIVISFDITEMYKAELARRDAFIDKIEKEVRNKDLGEYRNSVNLQDFLKSACQPKWSDLRDQVLTSWHYQQGQAQTNRDSKKCTR